MPLIGLSPDESEVITLNPGNESCVPMNPPVGFLVRSTGFSTDPSNGLLGRMGQPAQELSGCAGDLGRAEAKPWGSASAPAKLPLTKKKYNPRRLPPAPRFPRGSGEGAYCQEECGPKPVSSMIGGAKKKEDTVWRAWPVEDI